MTSYAPHERAALADLLDSLGPDAPTCCAGWATADLAAHLVVRERRPLAMPGIAVPALAGLTEREMTAMKRRPYAEVVDLVRTGPPRWSPMALLPFAEELVNGTELFIHHEDVRRAQPDWEPRELPDDQQATLWSGLRRSAGLMLRRAPTRVRLVAADGGSAEGGSGDESVTVTAPAAELVLFCSGRQAYARVEVGGDATLAGAVRSAPLGM